MASLPLGMDRHRHQGDGDLLAGGQELVHLPLGRRAVAADAACQCDEIVGGVAHGADDDDDLVALLLGRDGPAGGLVNPLRVGNAAAAEFLNDQAQVALQE